MGLKDLIKAQQSVKKEHPTNPKEIFLNELVHEQGYEYLRENQARFLDEWYKNKNHTFLQMVDNLTNNFLI